MDAKGLRLDVGVIDCDNLSCSFGVAVEVSDRRSGGKNMSTTGRVGSSSVGVVVGDVDIWRQGGGGQIII